MTVSINIDLRNTAGPALRKLMLTARDVGPALDDIGSSLVTSTQQRFEDEKSPEGVPWKRLADSTLKKRRQSAKDARKLRASTELYDSISHRVESDTRVRVGANRPYARIQQLGGKAGRGRKVKLDARPYLGLSDADRAEVVAIVTDHLKKAVR